MNDIKFRAFQDNEMLYQEATDISGLKVFFDKLRSGCILMESSGIKDSTGRDIWEGDILRIVATNNTHHQKGAIENVVIKKFLGNMCVCLSGAAQGPPLYPTLITHTKTVIGNIHTALPHYRMGNAETAVHVGTPL